MLASNLWFFCALGASIMWGLGYVITEILLKHAGLSPAFIMASRTILLLPCFAAISLYQNQIAKGLDVLLQSPRYLGLLAIEAVLVMVGVFLMTHAISMKNATTANLIEISYPFFTAIFAYFILKDVQVNVWTGLGGLLIFAGIGLIYLKS